MRSGVCAMCGAVAGGLPVVLDCEGEGLDAIVQLTNLGRAIDGVLLHVLGHVGILQHCFAVGHDW